MSDTPDLGTTGNTAAQAEGSTGTDHTEIGSMNNLGVTDPVQPVQKVVQPPVAAEVKKEEPSQSKDERHFSQKINEMTDSRTSMAQRLVEADKDAIYDIATDDPKLAAKLLAENDFGADTVEELLELRDNPEAKKEEIKKKAEENNRLTTIEEDLFNEKVLRLKTQHPDLDDDLVDEFKKVYSNDAFSDKTETQQIAIARASLGKTPETKKVDNSALEILRAQEGLTTTPVQTGEVQKPNMIPKERAEVYNSSNVSEADMQKYLPDDIDKEIAFSYGNLGEAN